MNFIKFAGVVVTSAVLAACGSGGGGGTVPVAKANAVLPVNATTGATVAPAIENVPVTFTSGVSQLGTAGTPTTLTVKPSGTAETFTVAAGSNTASGDLTYGSCIFTVKASTFTAPSPLAVGSVVTVDPCTITLSTNGVIANGGTATVTVTVTLGTATGTGQQVVSIQPNGDVIINGKTVGKVTIGETSGV